MCIRDSRYSDATGNPVAHYPANPNGSIHDIAGICDATGLVLGMMPHPERYVEQQQHPNWRRGFVEPHGLPIFKNAIQYVKEM